MPRQTVGILGGMGPEATCDLFMKIIKKTPAKRDQEHLRIIVDNNPQIPDRTAAILDNGEDPVPLLLKTARNLEQAGADFLVVPCNTAHYFHEAICSAVSIPVLHIMRETADTLSRMNISKAGLLASSGTVQTGLYNESLVSRDIEVVLPAEDEQKLVMDAIYAIKAGEFDRSARLVRDVAQTLIRRGSQAIIAGCTEIPLVLRDGDIEKPVIDATLVLAKAAVRQALGDSNI